jgi:hypothetical protein
LQEPDRRCSSKPVGLARYFRRDAQKPVFC